MGLFDSFKRKTRKDTEVPTLDHAFSADDLFEQGQALEASMPSKSFESYLKAAEMGHADAMRKVGLAYLYKEHGAEYSAETSAQWIEKSAVAGNVKSMLLLSQFYMAGIGKPQSDEKAREWLSKVVESSDDEKALEIATRRLNDFETAKIGVCALLKTAEEMGGLPPR